MLVTLGIRYMVIQVYRCMMGSLFISRPARMVPVVDVVVSRSGVAEVTSIFWTTLPIDSWASTDGNLFDCSKIPRYAPPKQTRCAGMSACKYPE